LNRVATDSSVYPEHTRNAALRTSAHRCGGRLRHRAWTILRNRPACGWGAADIVRIENGRLAEHWDVLQDKATKAESKSGLPMFGDRFTA
jgi:hypothetical protein